MKGMWACRFTQDKPQGERLAANIHDFIDAGAIANGALLIIDIVQGTANKWNVPIGKSNQYEYLKLLYKLVNKRQRPIFNCSVQNTTPDPNFTDNASMWTKQAGGSALQGTSVNDTLVNALANFNPIVVAGYMACYCVQATVFGGYCKGLGSIDLHPGQFGQLSLLGKHKTVLTARALLRDDSNESSWSACWNVLTAEYK
jgi:hypothetical protein